MITQHPECTRAFAQYTVFVKNSEQVQEKLKAGGVPTTARYPVPLPLQPAYKSLCRISGNVAKAEERAKMVMSLSISPDLDLAAQDTIVQTLSGAWQ